MLGQERKKIGGKRMLSPPYIAANLQTCTSALNEIWDFKFSAG